MQVVSIVFSTKEGGMENVATQKRGSKETVERYYTGSRTIAPRTVAPGSIPPG